MNPYEPSAVPESLYALQLAARHDPHERAVLADWYEETGNVDLATATRHLHGLYQPDASTKMTEILVSRPEVARLWRDELPERSHRTRTRVDKMTAQEAGQMHAWTEKWIKIGLSTERADRPRFEAAVAACYRYSNLKEPRAIIWAPCPIVAVYAGSIATAVLRRHGSALDSVYDSVGASVGVSVVASLYDSMSDSVLASLYDSVRDSVYDSVNASVYASVHASVYASVSASVSASALDSVGASVGASVRASVRASVDASVDASVRASVAASVYASVDASVNASVNASVRDSVNASVRDSVNASVALSVGASDLKQWYLYNGGQFWASSWSWWGPAAVSFVLDVLRLDIGREQELKARAYAATCNSACWWWPHRDFVVVSERPVLIDKHHNGKLLEARWEWRDKEGRHCEWSVKP